MDDKACRNCGHWWGNKIKEKGWSEMFNEYGATARVMKPDWRMCKEISYCFTLVDKGFHFQNGGNMEYNFLTHKDFYCSHWEAVK